MQLVMAGNHVSGSTALQNDIQKWSNCYIQFHRRLAVLIHTVGNCSITFTILRQNSEHFKTATRTKFEH